MPSAQNGETSVALIPPTFVAPSTGFVRMLIEAVQHEEMLLDRLTLAVQDGSDAAVITSIARKLVECRTRAGSGVAAENAELPE